MPKNYQLNYYSNNTRKKIAVLVLLRICIKYYDNENDNHIFAILSAIINIFEEEMRE